VRSSTELAWCLGRHAKTAAMSLSAFQHVLGALVADRAFCGAVRENAALALAGRDLSPREVRRLAAMAATRGMTASGTLYRLNRLMPLHRCLPRTLEALGSILPGLIEQFWRTYPETRLQFEEEVERFASFVAAQIAAGVEIPPLAASTLAFEAAACRLLFHVPGEVAVPDGDAMQIRLHPSVAVVQLQMEPAAVFTGSADAGLPGEYYVLLDARGPELQAAAVSVAMGRVLALAEAGLAVPDDATSRSARAAGWLLN
jgi:hypothetical protein